MIEIIANAITESYCKSCRARIDGAGPHSCSFDHGCIEYHETVNAAANAVLAFARLIQGEAVWRAPGVLRDTISELENLRGDNVGNI